MPLPHTAPGPVDSMLVVESRPVVVGSMVVEVTSGPAVVVDSASSVVLVSVVGIWVGPSSPQASTRSIERGASVNLRMTARYQLAPTGWGRFPEHGRLGRGIV